MTLYVIIQKSQNYLGIDLDVMNNWVFIRRQEVSAEKRMNVTESLHVYISQS